MADTPKENEEKYTRYLEALKVHAPDKSFGGVSVTQLETQVAKSNTPRINARRLNEERKIEEAAISTEDINTMKLCEMIKKGVVADPNFGDNSALYEALGYVRKSDIRSGLTRRKKTEAVK